MKHIVYLVLITGSTPPVHVSAVLNRFKRINRVDGPRHAKPHGISHHVLPERRIFLRGRNVVHNIGSQVTFPVIHSHVGEGGVIPVILEWIHRRIFERVTPVVGKGIAILVVGFLGRVEIQATIVIAIRHQNGVRQPAFPHRIGRTYRLARVIRPGSFTFLEVGTRAIQSTPQWGVSVGGNRIEPIIEVFTPGVGVLSNAFLNRPNAGGIINGVLALIVVVKSPPAQPETGRQLKKCLANASTRRFNSGVIVRVPISKIGLFRRAQVVDRNIRVAAVLIGIGITTAGTVEREVKPPAFNVVAINRERIPQISGGTVSVVTVDGRICIRRIRIAPRSILFVRGKIGYRWVIPHFVDVGRIVEAILSIGPFLVVAVPGLRLDVVIPADLIWHVLASHGT